MSAACTACGSGHTIRHDTLPGSTLRLDGERIVKVSRDAERRLCRSCGRTFRVPEPGEALELGRVADHAARLAFSLGRAGACRATGLEERPLARLLRGWVRLREGELPPAEVDLMLLRIARQRNRERILAVDADAGLLVDVLDGAGALRAWLLDPARAPPTTVCLPLDPAIAATVREALPGAALALAPSTALRGIRSALAGGMRVLRRLPAMRGSNGMPGTARVLRAFDRGTPLGDGCPREVPLLVAAAAAAARIAAQDDPALAERLWPEFEIAADVPGGRPLARLMRTWRAEILEGLRWRFVDAVAAKAERLARLALVRRPSLAFGDFRALALHHGAPPGRERAGRGLDEAIAILAAPAGAAPA